MIENVEKHAGFYLDLALWTDGTENLNKAPFPMGGNPPVGSLGARTLPNGAFRDSL